MARRSGYIVAALALAVCAFTAAIALTGGGDPAEGASSEASTRAKVDKTPDQPNIVVVMTDDQTVESMRVLPKVRKLIADEGITFANNFASNPVCCPSRSTFLSGQYSHNTGVLRNSLPDGGFASFDNSETLPVWLQRAGYYTAHVGKYLNGYGATNSGPTFIPPGWSEWYGAVDPSTYRMYGYTLNENGNLVTYGDYDTPDPANYQTDVYADKAVDFIQRRAPRSQPFYLSMAPLAPHVEVFARPSAGDDDPPTPSFPNPRPAPRDAGAFGNENLPKSPSFNEADVSDKPEGIRNRALLTPQAAGMARNRYRSRLGSLLAVDDMVGRIVGALRKSGELNNTVIMFLSDNGFLLGEHRIPTGKQYPYEESIRVPFEIRGPGIPKNEVRQQMAANVDLAPTILDLAGATAGGPIDGRSLMPLIEDPNRYFGRGIVLENWCQVEEKLCYDPYNPTVPRYRGVRTDRFAYMRYPNGEQEMYDLQRDPNELNSLQNSKAYGPERQALSKLLDRIQVCRTKACRTSPKLKLKLAYKPGRLGGGKPCTASSVNVRVGGKDAGESVSARFITPGKDTEDGRRPLHILVKRSELNSGGNTPISANVSVLDGRIATVSGKVPGAC
ncbi:MAG: sulfatase [Solirubrobacterales bacterium]|nr:sulfatase [Solirubrobacterales bacterium]